MTQKAEANLKYVIATHAAEQMTPSRRAIGLCEEIAEGRISGDYAVEQIKRSYGLKEETLRG